MKNRKNNFAEGFVNGAIIAVLSWMIGRILYNLINNNLSSNLQTPLWITGSIILVILLFFWIKILIKFYKEVK